MPQLSPFPPKIVILEQIDILYASLPCALNIEWLFWKHFSLDFMLFLVNCFFFSSMQSLIKQTCAGISKTEDKDFVYYSIGYFIYFPYSLLLAGFPWVLKKS